MQKAVPKTIKKRTAARKAAFLQAFGDSGSVGRSARIAGINRTTHYEWLAQDTKYQAAFDRATQMAKGTVLDELLRQGLIGNFKPIVYKGEFQYAKRERTLCVLEDGTTAFEDQLPRDARVIQRRTVTTRGEQLGFYKINGRALWKAAVLLMPERYGKGVPVKGKKNP